MKPVRVLSTIIALGLIAAVFGAGSVLAKQASNGNLGQLDASHAPAAAVAPADSEVAWAAADGEDASFVSASSTAVFFINDDGLETTKIGIADWSGLKGDQQAKDVTYNIATGTVNDGAATYFELTATDYNSTTPANTPLTAGPTVTVAGANRTLGGYTADTGTFTLLTAGDANASTTATFSYHLADVWSAADSTTQRAKVISTSDPAGEYVTIREVNGIGTTTASATSKIFRGSVTLSPDAATRGSNDDGVWVQDGDTVTVNYLNSDGTVVNSDTVTVDGVEPTISAISPADGTITNVENPTITFEVTDVGSGIKATDPASSVTITIQNPSVTTTIGDTKPAFQAIADGFRVIFAQGTSWLSAVGDGGFAVKDGEAFTWAIVATDVAGNSATLTGGDLDITIDISSPHATASVTGTSFDAADETEGTDDATAVKVTFNEALDDSTVAVSDFTVAGVVPTDVIVGTTDATDNSVYLTVATLAPDAKPVVKVVADIQDLAGNILNDETIASTDGLAPSMTVAVSQALAVEDDLVEVTVTTDEKLKVAGLTLSVNGPPGSAGAGAITTTSPTTNVNEGTLTVAAGTKTGAYGASILITDLGNNSVDNLTDITDETVPATDVTPGAATTVIKLANGPIGDTDFDGDVDKDDIEAAGGLSFSVNAATSSAITVVDASARTITVNVVVGAAETATVSYSYVADDVFEVDQAAPTVAFDPADDTQVENQSPFIRITFDEDEYPGDNFTTVTLTKADLTMPDGTITDLLASFVSSDNIEYIWAAQDLALGDYTLTISGTDTAGNAITDAASNFTIAERAPYDVALRPGWNLVSLPGAPADSDINAVVTNADVEVVLTYDPTVPGGWLTAVRDAEGNLAGTLTSITGKTALWVRTVSFEPLSVDIPGIAAGAASVPPSFKLAKGYNLVGVATLDLATATRDADEYFTGLDWSRAYGYNNVTNKFEAKLPDTADEVTTGQGYWLFLNAAGTLVP